MMAELEGRDHWRVGKTCAVRVHVEPRYAEYSPAFDGEVPEGFSAAAPCKVRKRFIDGTVKDCEAFYCRLSLRHGPVSPFSAGHKTLTLGAPQQIWNRV